ncbi:MAG: hypothetical protein BGO98_04460 [Myxococcales bacterium 68-20]|nr:MAG: hypothetical protein BGO98_04460 [Myxococcales bacterium 68-20]
MDATRLNELAGLAEELSKDVMRPRQPGEAGAWFAGLRGLLDVYFPKGVLEPTVADALDVKTLGQLTMHSEWLAQRKTLTSDTRPMTRDKLNTVAAALRTVAKKAPSPAPAPSAADQANAEAPIYRVGEWRLLDEPLGRGGQGSVVLVWHEKRYLRGALKRPRSDKKLTDKAKTRFLREIEVFRSVKHPFILKVLDAGEAGADSDLFLVTEVAPFGSLKDNIAVFAGDAWRTLRLARDIARGLAAVHAAGIVHRDLKPENLLLYSLDHALVGDFGIAHLADKEGVTSVDEKVGSYWFAPREYEMKAEPTPAFDVFSLGAILHSTLSGIGRPDEPYRVMKARRSLTEQFGTSKFKPLDTLLDRMLTPEPEKRLQSMDAVVADIDQILGGLLGGAGFGGDCAFCGKGQYKDAGALRAGSSTELLLFDDRGRINVNLLQHTTPHVLICDSCGDIRWRATTRPQ